MDAEKRAFTAQQQVGFSAAVCVCVFVPLTCVVFAVVSGAVDGGEAGGLGQSVWRLGGAAVSAVSGAAGVGAGEGGGHRSAGSAAGRAGQSSEFHILMKLQSKKNKEKNSIVFNNKISFIH